MEFKDGSFVLLTIYTLTLLILFLFKFSMNQMGRALKQNSRGASNKHHAAERWELEFGFQTQQKIFSNTSKKLKIFAVVFEPISKSHLSAIV